MSTQDKPDKPDLARGWQALEKMAAEDDPATQAVLEFIAKHSKLTLTPKESK